MDEQKPQTAASTSVVQTQHRLARWLWFSLGFVFVGLGGLGIILPVLPTTIFFIGAAACFARSSPRFEQWVLNLPTIGPLVRDYRSGFGMRRRAKIIATLTIATTILLSSIFIPSWAGRAIAYGVALVGISYIMLHVPTRERVLAEREVAGQHRN